ncbi:hypothetical protein [Vagococcus fluvialis]|uniref:hypothetical protein n=1 Tax=Vagococcus fluvialis TaxID=2738 RepID=UPI003D14CD79
MNKEEKDMSRRDRENQENEKMKGFKNTIGSNLEDHQIDRLQDPDEKEKDKSHRDSDKEERDKEDESVSPLVDPEVRDPNVPLVNEDPNKPLSPLTEPNERERSGDNFNRE